MVLVRRSIIASRPNYGAVRLLTNRNDFAPSSLGMVWIGKRVRYEWNTQHALEAFLTCCNIDDAGSNGCYGAGRMAEKLGDPQKAIEYYRLSRWDGALKRADELEAELNTGN